MARRIQLRRDTAANWSSTNPTLAQGEIGIDLTNNKIKIGNGTQAWNALAYWDDKEPSTFDGSYNSLTGKPNLADVATSGDYDDLSNTPTIPSIGAFEFAGSTLSTTDSSGITIDPNVVVTSDLTVGGDILPSVANGGNIGSPEKPWNSLYVSTNTIFLGSTVLGVNDSGQITSTSGFAADSITVGGVNITVNPSGQIESAGGFAVQNSTIIGSTDLGLGASLEAYDGEITDNVELRAPIDGSALLISNDSVKTAQTSMGVQGDLAFIAVHDAESNMPAFSWLFKDDGNLQLPVGGDIVDSNGSSVLGGGGGGEPTIPNTVKGFINLVGDKPNDDDDMWFESVVVRGQYAYTIGKDFYIDGSNDSTKVYKFDLETGTQIWVKQIAAGRNATFNISVGEGLAVLDGINTAGEFYTVGEELYIPGWYFGGNENINRITITVDSVDEETGAILTASIKPGYNVDGLSSTQTGVQPANDNAQGDPAAIAYDDFNDKLIVTSEYRSGLGDTVMDSYWMWSNVYVIDPVSGEINQTVTLSDEGDVYTNSISTYDKTGGVAIVGEKYNEYRQFGTLTLIAGYNGYFDILKSNIDEEHYPGAPFDNSSDFWVSGTGISTMQNVDNVNYYFNLPTTVREGSGAQVTIGENGSGSYTLIGIAAAGTNYLSGHILRVLGTDLGGTTPANDALLQIISVDGSGGVTAAGISGTAFATAPVGGWTVSTVNYNVGSGAQFSVYVNAVTGAYSYGGYNNSGSNYVPGDVLTIAGTAFAGGASPANDATLVVNSVDGNGSILSVVNGEVTGTGQSNTLRIYVDGVDFSVEGSWSMKQNLGGEAFVWTPAWNKAIGAGGSNERFYDVCWSSDGNYLYAVGRGRYEVAYDQALVVKYDATNGDILWSQDIKFSEADTNNREAHAVIEIPGSTDIVVAGAWYNNNSGYSEIILTRITAAGAAVWQKTYLNDNGQYVNYEMNLKATNNGIIVSLEHGTNNGDGVAYLQIDPTDGTVIRHRVLSADGNSNNVYYETPTSNFADIYTDADGDYIVIAGHSWVPTDNYSNALLVKLPLDGLKAIGVNERYSIGEHIMTRHTWTVTTVTPAFVSFTATEHPNGITGVLNGKGYRTVDPQGQLQVWTTKITDDAAGFLEFGDGSKQSFATNIIPQIPAANDYYLTEQDSGKHIFFEHENGRVYIPHWNYKNLPVGFTFTVVNTTGSYCYVECESGETSNSQLKLAGRNISTWVIYIPDSGSGSMVTFLKIKQGYYMSNSDGDVDYPDVWMVSGPGDIGDDS